MIQHGVEWTKEENDLGRTMVQELAVYMHENVELANWFDGKDSIFGQEQLTLWPEDIRIMARYVLANYKKI